MFRRRKNALTQMVMLKDQNTKLRNRINELLAERARYVDALRYETYRNQELHRALEVQRGKHLRDD